VHSVVVPRLDDLVAELCQEGDGCGSITHNHINNTTKAVAAADGSNQLLTPTTSSHQSNLPFLGEGQEYPEFQYLEGINVFTEDLINYPTWEATANSKQQLVGATEEAELKIAPSAVAFDSTAVNNNNNNLLIVAQQQQQNELTEDKNSLNDDLIMTPTAEKLLEEIWLENMNQEAEDCFQHIYPELD